MKREASEILVIAGPTAVGKTALSLALAGESGADIISADSRQVYRGMDIGTAKPSKSELKRIKHHLIDIIDPDRPYSAAAFARDARQVMDSLDREGKKYVVVGGSGLYLKALIEGLVNMPPADEGYREKLRGLSREKGKEYLHNLLKARDPETAARLSQKDAVRIIRALEVFHLTGRPLSRWFREQREKDHRRYRLVVLDLVREHLYRRIECRVDEMLKLGLVKEVKALVNKGFGPDDPGMKTVGYQEILSYLDGRCDLETAVAEIKLNTRHFAKRQLTWFRKMIFYEWYNLHDDHDYLGLTQKLSL
jgi:tRNA dimethylallyltransferase